MNRSETDKILALAREKRWLRVRDVREAGMNPEALRRLYQAGSLHRVARGIYTLPEIEPEEHHSLAESSLRVRRGVICLLSALRFHEFTTQAPFEVWMAIEGKDRTPHDEGVPLRIVRMSGAAFKEGIDMHQIEGVPVRVFNVAKTVADCFKYRNKIGLDVAIEALKESQRERRCSIDELWHYATICRVANVMRPYLESVV